MTFVGAGIETTVIVILVLEELAQVLNPSAKYVVVTEGVTVNIPPFEEVPNNVPPVELLHHLIIPPGITAIN